MDPARLTIGLTFGPYEVVCRSANRAERAHAREVYAKTQAEEFDAAEVIEDMESTLTAQVERVERDGAVALDGEAARAWVHEMGLFELWDDLGRAFPLVFFRGWLTVPGEDPRGPGGDGEGSGDQAGGEG